MQQWSRAALLGLTVACATDGEDTPRAADPCDDGEPARCGFGEGLDATQNAVLVCNGDAWSSALSCGANETCSDDDDRGAVVCTDEFDQVIYGEHTGACAVEGAQACSFERDFVLVCTDGNWMIATNCSTDVLHCTLVTSEDDDTCSDAAGCLVCE